MPNLDFSRMSDEELLQQLEKARHQIIELEERVNAGETIGYERMRAAMGDVNLLKIQAIKRGLSTK